MNTLKKNINTYCLGHSKFYKPSLISEFLVEFDSSGNVYKFNNDVYLLTRQEKLCKKIGVDSIRAYIDSLVSTGDIKERVNLTEEQLFELIDPKEVNNLTTQYEYMKFLEKNRVKFKEKYENAVESHKSYSDFKNKYLTKK